MENIGRKDLLDMLNDLRTGGDAPAILERLLVLLIDGIPDLWTEEESDSWNTYKHIKDRSR